MMPAGSGTLCCHFLFHGLGWEESLLDFEEKCLTD
jgi:hypothetical protein